MNDRDLTELEAENIRLAEVNDILSSELAALKEQIAELKEQIAELNW